MARLLTVNNLKTQFNTEQGLVKAVDGISYHVDEKEVVCFAGESGCGKSVSQLSVIQLIWPPGKIVGGEVFFEDRDLLKYSAKGSEMRSIRGVKISMIFQEPMTSLNPVLTISQQLAEMGVVHLGMSSSAARNRAIELLELVGIPDAEVRIDHYPHELSGGMRQRVMIAIASFCVPKIIIADEPTTSVDVITQAQVLESLNNTVKHLNTSLVIVTHNLGVLARYADRIYVMYAGRIVETATSKDLYSNPRHPYTIGLLKSVPRLDEPPGRKLVPIEGSAPDLIDMPPTCAFLPRCPYKVDLCKQQRWPELRAVGNNHYVSCYVDITERQGVPIWMGRMSPSWGNIVSPSVKETILEVKNLKKYFPIYKGLLRKKVADIKAVDGVSLKIMKGETLGLVGESGCGKTTIGQCVVRMYPPTEGEIIFEGQDIAKLSEGKMRLLRRKMQLVFQDPYGSLDPRQNTGSIVGEPLKIHKMFSNRSEYRQKVEELLSIVGLDTSMVDRFSHEFSGGQRQRIGIARALATEPSLIVCDEPISALDVSIQAQIINLMQELQEKKGLTYLFIAHDLSVVRHISNQIAVMYLGRIVEIADSLELYEKPLHPYTKALLSAVPIPDPFVEEKRERNILTGDVPSPINPPVGCSFHPRCPIAIAICSKSIPQLHDVGNNHKVACFNA